MEEPSAEAPLVTMTLVQAKISPPAKRATTARSPVSFELSFISVSVGEILLFATKIQKKGIAAKINIFAS